MPLDTQTEVEAIANVQDSAGRTVKPASADFYHDGAAGVDLSVNPVSEALVAPDRADVVRVHVEAAGAARVVVEFLDGPDGAVLTSRTPADAAGYATDGTTDVFAECAVVSPYLRVRIEDNSDAANVAGWSLYVV